MRSMIAGIALSAIIGVAAAAETIYPRDVDKILAIAQGFGPAERIAREEEAPLIRGRLGYCRSVDPPATIEPRGGARRCPGAIEIDYLILFGGCDADGRGCSNVQFAAQWDAGADPDPAGQDLARVNAWNRDRRAGVAYVGEDGVVVLKMALTMAAGAERGTVEAGFERWRLGLGAFIAFYFP